MNRRRGLGTALLVAFVVAGCSQPVVGGPSQHPPTAAPTSVAARATARPSSLPAPAASYLYDPTADARADVVAALAAAKADGKRVLIDYGADWCPDCHSLAAVLDSAAGKDLIDANYHVVRVDVGYFDHNIDVATDYGKAIDKGIPSVVVLDGSGAVIGSTADGSLANARIMTAAEMLAILARWAE